MKNKQKGFVMALLITIIAVLLAGGGTYIYLNKGQNISSGTVITPQSQEVKANTPTSVAALTTTTNTDIKVFACDNSYYSSSENKANTAGNIAAFKALNYQFMVYLNNHASYPTSLASIDNYGTKQDISSVGYLYAYYPKVNPTHYHLGMKIQNGASCSKLVASNLKSKANFNSKISGYVNGFDGTDASILDFNDSQNN